MSRRLQLQKILESAKGLAIDPLTCRPAVYFQPPSSVKLVYPCIVYVLDGVGTKHADNKPYMSARRYKVTIIDKDPDSEIPDMLLNMPQCKLDRPYTADNLNHWVFSLYY